MFGHLGWPELALIAVVVALWLLVIAFPASKICRRLGFSPYLGLVAVIPVANLLLLFYIAFASWPAMAASDTRHQS